MSFNFALWQVNKILKIIQKSDEYSSANDGDKSIRLIVPALTEERRKEIGVNVGEEEENAKIAIRTDVMRMMKFAENEKK